MSTARHSLVHLRIYGLAYDNVCLPIERKKYLKHKQKPQCLESSYKTTEFHLVYFEEYKTYRRVNCEYILLCVQILFSFVIGQNPSDKLPYLESHALF